MSSAATDVDIAVIGGGLSGLIFVALLADACEQSDIVVRIALIETDPPVPTPENTELDLRVSAITPASKAILQTLNIWQHLPADRVSPFRRMCVWQAAGSARGARSIHFDAAELAQPELGHIIENRAMRAAAWALLQSFSNVELLTQARPATVTAHDDYYQLEFDAGTTLRTRLLVGADGGNSWVRQQLGVTFNKRDYEQIAIVAHVATEQSHAQTAWQRFLPEGPVALLPLANGDSSLVWSCPVDRAAELLLVDSATFGMELTAAMDHVLGPIKCQTPRASFPLALGYASHYTGKRFALIGDAAHRVHPLAGQGANLGLLDAATLAEELAAHLCGRLADPGDPRVLRRYERARKGDNLLTMGAMDALNRMFRSPFADTAGLGLEAIDRAAIIKNWLAHYATGAGRDAPAAARPQLM